MNCRFDPYYKWLGIPPEKQPPDHYQLLGIDQFEDDLDVIEHAADRQMAHLRTFQNGEHRDESQRLLNEVATARTCLLRRQSKREYDHLLRRRLEPAHPTPPAPAMVLQADERAMDWDAAEEDAFAARRRKPRGAAGLPLGAAFALLAALVALIAMVLLSPTFSAMHKPVGPSGTKHKADNGPSVPGPKPPRIGDGQGSQGGKDDAGARKKPTPQPDDRDRSDAPTKPDSPEVEPHLQQARKALSDRNVPAARDALERAKETARTKADRAVVSRVEALTDYVEGFWKGMPDFVSGLRLNEEIAVNGERLMVREASRETLVVRGEGGVEHAYSVPKLPHAVIDALTGNGLSMDAPSKAMLAAYLTVEPEGDRQRASSLWKQARAAGAAIRRDMEIELDEPAFREGRLSAGDVR